MNQNKLQKILKEMGLPDHHLHHGWASLVANIVKRLPEQWETWVQSLDQEDPLEKEMATHFSTLAWKIP